MTCTCERALCDLRWATEGAPCCAGCDGTHRGDIGAKVIPPDGTPRDRKPKRPLRCHFDRQTRDRRIDRRHLDDCPDRAKCDGCQPCETPHCVLCGSRHVDDQHPLVDAHCVGAIRTDLAEVLNLCKQLRAEASTAGNDGRLLAAAPIPGGDAMVLIGPSSDRVLAAELYDSWKAGLLKKQFSTYGKDHRVGDPLPPLALLADWEDIWRRYLQVERGRRASIRRAVEFLDSNLTLMAQVSQGPDITVFARDIQTCRARLEGVLHDEEAPERGVECFDCGVRLVRRIRERKRCPHSTPARQWFRVLSSYWDNGLRPTVLEARAARMPCQKCSQGGVDDPRPSFSWECPGCRRPYTPGEYHNAVQRDLMDSDDGDPWQPISVAAEAASTLARRPVAAGTVRKWMDRGEIGSLCLWTPGRFWGQRVVYWPDVRDRATKVSSSSSSRRAS